MIQFDAIVLWSDEAQICEEICSIGPGGTTNPSCIFTNLQTKTLFEQSDLIVFLSDGQIEHQHVSKVNSSIQSKENFFSF